MDCTSKNVGPYRLCIRGVSQAMFRVRVPTQLLSLSGPTMPTTFSAVFYVPGSAPLCMNITWAQSKMKNSRTRKLQESGGMLNILDYDLQGGKFKIEVPHTSGNPME
eukprot:1141378-Pelagomonas_calceolata.AAC.4